MMRASKITAGFVALLLVFVSSATLAQDASVGIGALPTSSRNIISPIAGKMVFLTVPEYRSRLGYETTMTGMSDWAERLELIVVGEIQEADYVMVGRYTVDLSRRKNRGLDLAGVIGGLFGQNRAELESRDEKWEFVAKFEASLSIRGQNSPGVSVLRIVGSGTRDTVQSADQRVRVSTGRGSIGFGGSSDRAPEIIAAELLAATIRNAEIRKSGIDSKRVPKFFDAFQTKDVGTYWVKKDDSLVVVVGHRVVFLSDDVKVGQGQVVHVGRSKVTIEVIGGLKQHDGSLEVEF